MNMRVLRLCGAGIVAALTLGAPKLAFTQTATISAATPAPVADAAAEFHPSMGDLMTMAVQPRHIKLGLAGKEKNWDYAAYELSELRNAFARIARTIPTYQNAATADLVKSIAAAPLDAVEQAIKAMNAAQFNSAYHQLTQACNVCHQSQNHQAVVIKVPETAMYPDQDFRPVPR